MSNTGILPPKTEGTFQEGNVFQNESNNEGQTPPMPTQNSYTPSTENSASNENNSPLGNAPAEENVGEGNGVNAVEVPSAAMNTVGQSNTGTVSPLNAVNSVLSQTPVAKKAQTAAQKKKINTQKSVYNSLVAAGVAKPHIRVTAPLAAMGMDNPNYQAAFNAVVANSGRSFPNQYRVTTRKKRPAKGNTVVNATTPTASRGVNSGIQATSRGVGMSIQTNMRNRNIVNSNAVSGTVDILLGMADTIQKELTTMKQMMKTLKARPPARKRTVKKKNQANSGLSTVAEGNEENNSEGNSIFGSFGQGVGK
jgi:hypothetical protein